MNYYFESEFFANSQLTPQQQEKPTREEMLKMAISDVNKKNKKILENPLNQESSNISDKQLQEFEKEINQLNKEGEALSRKYRIDQDKQLAPVLKQDLEKIMKEGTELAKRRHPELWVNDSKQILTDKTNDFDKPVTESNYNGVLIIGISLFLLAILFIFKWRKSLFKRLIVVKNLIIQKLKFEDSNRAKKVFNLLVIVWILFHLFMLLTSEDIFKYPLSWKGLWFFDYWADSYNRPYGYDRRYDITEFSIYVIIPLVIFFGKKYLNGEQLSSFKVRSSITKSNTDVQINDIKKYKELFDLGVISEAEFIEQKRKILNK